MRHDTLMLWMSSIKPVTAVAIAQMWERGKLELDDPVARHIPEFAPGGKERVTIRHVLTHTGGFPGAVLQWSADPWEKIIAELCDSTLEVGWGPASEWVITWRRDGTHSPRSCGESTAARTRSMCARRSSSRSHARHVLGMPLERHPSTRLNNESRRCTSRPVLMKPIPHNYALWGDSAEALAVCRPGGSARGPIHDLGKFYEAMLAGAAT